MISERTPSTLAGSRNLVSAGKALAQRVQGTRPDVAVDDAKRCQNQEGNS